MDVMRAVKERFFFAIEWARRRPFGKKNGHADGRSARRMSTPTAVRQGEKARRRPFGKGNEHADGRSARATNTPTAVRQR